MIEFQLILLVIILLISLVVIGLISVNFFNIFFLRVDHKSRHHGGEIVAQILKNHNVHHIFTLPGGHISPIIVAAEKLNIKIIDTRHEATAVFAADAMARLNQNIGVACVTAGPGFTNTITALKNAQMAESPILVITGAAATLLKGRGSLQDIEQLNLCRSACKDCFTINSIRNIPHVIENGIRVARSGRPGPVVIEIPIDLLYEISIITKELGGEKLKKKSIFSTIKNLYLDYYIFKVFAGAFDVDVTGRMPLSIDIPSHKSKDVKLIDSLLQSSKKPVLIIGSQIMQNVDVQLLRGTLEKLGIPCFLSGMARGLLHSSSKILMKFERSKVLKEADVIVLLGTVCDFRLKYGRVFSKKSKIISINKDREQLLQNSDMFWKPFYSVIADSGKLLIDLQSYGEKLTIDKNWMNYLTELQREKKENIQKKIDKKSEKYTNPLFLLNRLEDHIDEETILIVDGGDFVASASYIVKPKSPLHWLDPGPFGTLGCGAGFALGAKLAKPDCKVVVIYGDGSYGYSLMEFDTFAKFSLPIMAVIGNDACWTQIAREQVPMLGSDIGCRLEYRNYEKITKEIDEYKIFGTIITKNEEVEEKLLESFGKWKDRRSAIINVLIDKSDFRDGSVSV
ncbi:hypothetical protein SNEBB_001004 [Seison nebaliae]|nr:hypothetical protein SNEBB_001004 [Seison nebaliae]